MITIKDFMEVVDYRITEGSDFLWQCFGPNVYCLDSWNGDHDGHSIGITFDTKNQTVYKFEAHDYSRNNSYRWTHPDWKEIAANEAKIRGVDHSEAWDEVKYTDLDIVEDMLEKARAIVNGVDAWLQLNHRAVSEMKKQAARVGANGLLIENSNLSGWTGAQVTGKAVYVH
jgi:hypothetical protein